MRLHSRHRHLVISFLNLSGAAGNLGLVADMAGVAWVGFELLRTTVATIENPEAAVAPQGARSQD